MPIRTFGLSMIATGAAFAAAALAYTFTRHTTRNSVRVPRPSSVLPPLSLESNERGTSHELSSLLGDHALAPDRSRMGEELSDQDVVEVPVGHSADRGYDEQLRHAKLQQPETTGSVLRQPHARHGLSQVSADLDPYPEVDVDLGEFSQDIDGGVSARPRESLFERFEAYDAVEADDLGSEFLARATQTPRLNYDEPLDDVVELPDQASELIGGGTTMSEGSVNAAQLPNDQGAASIENDPISSAHVEVPRTVWEATLLYESNKR